MLSEFSGALIFLIMSGLIVVITLLFSRVIHPRAFEPQKYEIYECGEEAIGKAWIQFNNRFYIIALIFLIFDVEIVLLYPWGVVFKDLGLIAYIEMFIFVAILLFGLGYVWVSGDLDWEKPRPKYFKGDKL
ncbi:MAG: NADH-quinone oxidoreductase subunit A [Candidatus Fischerbacteria bacterium RBG_13_37_8]|uniref:NADH-quinone oxidoreductase subunit A n=1 Tax=Candidatus Fischerbacteria bacterium RBG_13_37_8 TaxID=1817863 RepID=A0A1F5VRH6_9BACT|nr:MAG: NADH-quinone oxidoreductase subunit A [Candidatus Fischerbacteria bacterium RBG_13_37_8]